MRRNNISGQTFGRLTAIGIAGISAKQSLIWECLCVCGGKKNALAYELRSGKVSSCGCKIKEGVAVTHGYARKGQKRSPTYSIWAAMLQRCRNPKDPAYAHYGGRGITVDSKWHSFVAFISDMGEAPKGMSLERKDNNKGYEKANCVWSTTAQQASNRRNNVWVLLDGEKMLFTYALKKIGYDRANAYQKMKRAKLTHQEVIDLWQAQKSV
jgi:hypothetical protein